MSNELYIENTIHRHTRAMIDIVTVNTYFSDDHKFFKLYQRCSEGSCNTVLLAETFCLW